MALTGTNNTVEVQIEGDSSGLVGAAQAGRSELVNLKNAAAAASGALAALASGGIAASVTAAADFNAAMTESLAIMGNVSGSMRDDMAQAARDVATETQFAAEEAANSYFYLASAGLDAAESIKTLPEVADFAQAGMFDMATATDILTDAQSALGLKTEELATLSDKLVKANTLANASVRQFGESLINKAAPAMERLGVTTDEGIAALATFADNGLKGRRAGTIFARTLENLAGKANKNAEEFEALGVTVFNADGEMRDLADITKDLEGALGDMSGEQRTAALAQLGFNRRARQGIDLLVGNSEELRTYEDELGNAGGTASDVANKQLQNLNAKWDLLQSKVNDIAITIGNVFVPILIDLADKVDPIIDAFAEWNEKSDGVVGAVSLVVSAVGGLGGVLLRFVGGPITLALSALATLAGAFGTNFKNIRTIATDAMETVRETVDGVMGALQDSIVDPALKTIKGLWSEHGDAVKREVKSGYEAAKSAVNTVVTTLRDDVITPVVDTLQTEWADHGDAVKRELKTGYQEAKTAINQILNTLRDDMVIPLIERIETEWAEHGDAVKQELKTSYQDTKTAVDTVLTQLNQDVITAKINEFETAWSEHAEPVKQKAKAAYKGVKTVVDEMLSLTKTDVIDPQIQRFEDAWDTHGDDVKESLTNSWGMIKDAIDETLTLLNEEVYQPTIELHEEIWGTHGDELKEELIETWDAITNRIDQILSFLFNEIYSPFIEKFLDDFLRFQAEAREAWDKWGDEIISIARFAFSTVLTVVGTLTDLILTGFQVFLNVLQGDWEEALTAIRKFLQRTFDRMYAYVNRWTGGFLDLIAGIVNDVIGWFKDLYNRLIGSSIIPDLLSEITSAFENWSLLSTVKGIIDDIKSEFSSWVSWVSGSFANSVSSAFGDVADSIGDALSNIHVDWPDLPNWLDDALDHVSGGIEDAVDWVENQRPSDGGSGSSGTSRGGDRDPRDGGGSSGTGSNPSGGRTSTGFAEGGIVTAREMPAMLHGPEAVMPLDKLPGLMADALATADEQGGAPTGSDDRVVRELRRIRRELATLDPSIDTKTVAEASSQGTDSYTARRD